MQRSYETETAMNDAAQSNGLQIIPEAREQDFLRQVWIEALGEMMGQIERRFEAAFKLVKAESTTAVAEMRAAVADMRTVMERQIEERLGHLRKSIDDKNGPQIHAYVEGVHYGGELVAYEGSTYQARCDTARAPTDEAHWTCVAAGGLDGRSLRIRGTYKAEEKYSQLDVVALNGGSFVARRSDPGICPGDRWQAIAFQGKKGSAGPKGDRGERGRTGASFTAWALDVTNYRAIPFTNDGLVGPVLDLRPFFEQYLLETSSA
jgi:hypothetical protein